MQTVNTSDDIKPPACAYMRRKERRRGPVHEDGRVRFWKEEQKESSDRPERERETEGEMKGDAGTGGRREGSVRSNIRET